MPLHRSDAAALTSGLRDLARTLKATVPPSAWRVGEHAITQADSSTLTYSSTVCLRRPLSQAELLALVERAHVTRSQRRQFVEFSALPCWRHSVRMDAGGGLGLHAERDFDDELIRDLCDWCGVGNVLADTVGALAQRGFVTGAAAVGWDPARESGRLRFHLIAEPAPQQWKGVVRALLRFLGHLQLDPGPRASAWLLGTTRRAVVVNLQEDPPGVAAKVEVPDVAVTDLPAFLPERYQLGRTMEAAGLRCSRLRYVGARLRPTGSTEWTAYLPWGALRPL
jgi:hypothetical protein